MADTDNIVKVSQLDTTLQHIRNYVDELVDGGEGIKNVTVSADGLQLQFWTSDDTTGEPAHVVDLPEEKFLDQVRTQFVQSFSFSEATYPGAVNPHLDNKPVFVLAVKGDKETNPTLSYSFVNLEGLIKTYTAGNAGIEINGSSVGVKLSADGDNILSIAQDGLLAEMKVPNAVEGNIAVFGSNGEIVDSGVTFADDADITAMLNRYFPTGGSSSSPNDGQ